MGGGGEGRGREDLIKRAMTFHYLSVCDECHERKVI